MDGNHTHMNVPIRLPLNRPLGNKLFLNALGILPMETMVPFSNLFAARLQMAVTLGFHIIFACLGVGLPVLMLMAEWRYLRTGDLEWKMLAHRWSRSFAVLFAVGAVSGTVLSFEMGLLWPNFMGIFGSVIGLPFVLEAFAFFLEGIFASIYLYAWDKLSPRLHWWSGFPIALGGFASAWFVVTANAWMNTPTGFQIQGGAVKEADPLAAMLNPATGVQTTHMILAAYIVTGFLIASFYALAQLRGDAHSYTKRALRLGLLLGTICMPFQIVAGDWAARTVARTQPAKFAAMEGQFKSADRAPLRIGGWPRPKEEVTRYALEIPGGLSWLAYRDRKAVVKGLSDFPSNVRPPVVIVHLAFQFMVAASFYLLFISAWAGWSSFFRKKLPDSRLFLWMVVVAGPLATMALQAGWIVTEVGRQPWIVYGFMRTADAVTSAPGVRWLFGGVLIVYFVLTVGTIVVLRNVARMPRGLSH